MIKKLVVFVSLLFLVIGIFMFVFADRFPLAAAPAECRIQGAWVGSDSGPPGARPLIIQNTITPQDLTGNKLTYVMRLVNPDATFFGLSPEAEYMSELVGEAVRTGLNTYDFSLIGYGAKEQPAARNEILYLWTVNGSLTCEDGDKITSDANLAVYEADQDANQDGFPDVGQDPIACFGPLDFGSAQRVPLMPRCEPEPPPEDE
jgi:hypothetical protein